MADIWEKRNAYRVLVGKPEEKSPPGNLGVDGRIILKWILNVVGGVDWIDLTQVWGRFLTFVSTVMNFRFA